MANDGMKPVARQLLEVGYCTDHSGITLGLGAGDPRGGRCRARQQAQGLSACLVLL